LNNNNNSNINNNNNNNNISDSIAAGANYRVSTIKEIKSEGNNTEI
jgi:hypothetical protein